MANRVSVCVSTGGYVRPAERYSNRVDARFRSPKFYDGDILGCAGAMLNKIYRPWYWCTMCGVTLYGLTDAASAPRGSLFAGEEDKEAGAKKMSAAKAIDAINPEAGRKHNPTGVPFNGRMVAAEVQDAFGPRGNAWRAAAQTIG